MSCTFLDGKTGAMPAQLLLVIVLFTFGAKIVMYVLVIDKIKAIKHGLVETFLGSD